MKRRDRRFRPIGMGWWVDPRICEVRVQGLQAYLQSRGWRIKPQPRTELLFFEKVETKGEDVQSIPASEGSSDFIQRVIEVITALASQEKRYAVEVLNDILEHPPPERSVNGPDEIKRTKSAGV